MKGREKLEAKLGEYKKLVARNATMDERDRIIALAEQTRPHPGVDCGCGECVGLLVLIDKLRGDEE